MGLFWVKIKMIGVILASAKMLYTGNDAEWCSWMCRALLSEYICRNSAAFCKMEALGFAGGDAWPRAQRGAKPQAGERGAFWYSYPFCVLGAEFVFRDGAKRKGKDSSLSVLPSEVTAAAKAPRCGAGGAWTGSSCSADLCPHRRQSSFPRCKERKCYSK